VLTGNVVRAKPGIHGFDIDEPLSGKRISDLKGAGFSFCIRYLTRAVTPPSSDLSAPEAEAILRGGLALMAVQHVAKKGWVPSQSLGTTNGRNAVAHAQIVGFPRGVNIWLDLEGVASGTASSAVIDYCNAWFSEVDGAGFVSGLYVGFDEVLTSDELFFDLKTHHYWKSASSVPEISHRGYQMFQSLPRVVKGVSLDSNVTKDDQLGDAVLLLEP